MDTKRLCGLTVAATVMSAGLFFACQKDNKGTLDGKRKVLDEFELKGLEFYTPDETVMGDKMISFTNCMNYPDEYPMPEEMEIREAIWCMETFFNIGVAAKQEHGVEYVDARKTYYFTVPLTAVEEDGVTEMLLNGEELQAVYKDVLITIKSEMDDENAINFGDVFVHALNLSGGYAEFGLEVLWGPARKSGVEEAPVHLHSMLKITPSSASALHYPGNKSSFKFPYPYGVEDEGMVATLNQTRVYLGAVSIVNVKKWSGAEAYYNPYTAVTTAIDYHIIDTITYTYFGKPYSGYIWTTIWPSVLADQQLQSYSFYPELQYFEPLWAFCDLHLAKNADGNRQVQHTYGLERICQFYDPVTWAPYVTCID